MRESARCTHEGFVDHFELLGARRVNPGEHFGLRGRESRKRGHPRLVLEPSVAHPSRLRALHSSDHVPNLPRKNPVTAKRGSIKDSHALRASPETPFESTSPTVHLPRRASPCRLKIRTFLCIHLFYLLLLLFIIFLYVCLVSTHHGVMPGVRRPVSITS